jgi:hypothetical protein
MGFGRVGATGINLDVHTVVVRHDLLVVVVVVDYVLWAKQEVCRAEKGRRDGLLVWLVWVFGKAIDLESNL